MVSKFIRESVAYWAKEYHIDGFRFDLMGLMDVDTMNGIRTDLDALPDGDKIIMYGEAWNMSTHVSSGTLLATQDNLYQLSTRIGAFNDSGRDAIKGSNFNAVEKGFVQDGSSKGGVRDAIEGSGSGWAKIPAQCVNYASCHDNLTLYDKLTASVHNDEKYTTRREDLVAMNRLSAATVLMSHGMPFMLAGEELGRTKQGDENSYKSSVEINQIDWKKDRIVLEQEKTGVMLCLPLLEDVGNSIMDYIMNERPEAARASPYVFVRTQAPYKKLASMYMVCSRLFSQAGIKTVNRDSQGVHVCRYTLTHKLLLKKVPHQVITDTLGHISRDSDKPYLSMEEQMLRECPLDFSLIGQKYWEEGEGHG